MVDHDLLHMELAALAATTTGDFDLHDALHQVSITAAAAFGLDGAGVTLHMPDGRTEYITATDQTTLHVERGQDALKQGACIDAMKSSEIVAVSDLTQETGRWPEYAPMVLHTGFHSVAGVPIPHQGRNIGAVNFYAAGTRAWTTDEFAAARLLANLAGGYLVNAHLLARTQTLAAQLQQALDSRIIIEQAKGMMAARHGMTPDAAFEILRTYARGNRVKIHDVARSVVHGDSDLLGGTTGGKANEGMSAP